MSRSIGHGLRGSHRTKPPRVWGWDSISVSGHLPPEVIQRIIRQNFGRFRLCYENGLRENPTLAGRVTVRFVIGRDGAVSTAANGGSDFTDPAVVSCVVRAFYSLRSRSPRAGSSPSRTRSCSRRGLIEAETLAMAAISAAAASIASASLARLSASSRTPSS